MYDYKSEKQQELANNHYYKTIKAFCEENQDPLLNLTAISLFRIIDDEQYTYFLNDFKASSRFYINTLINLENEYPDKEFTSIYQDEIEFLKLRIDRKTLAHYKKWNKILIVAIVFFLLIIAGLVVFMLKKNNNKSYLKQVKQHLTKQEIKVLNLIKEGKTNNEIAKILFVSLSTIKTHINNIYSKLNLSSRDELKDLNL